MQPRARCFELLQDLTQVVNATGQSVQLRDNQNIALPEVSQEPLKLWACGNGGNLFLIDALSASSGQLPLLSLEACYLFQR